MENVLLLHSPIQYLHFFGMYGDSEARGSLFHTILDSSDTLSRSSRGWTIDIESLFLWVDQPEVHSHPLRGPLSHFLILVVIIKQLQRAEIVDYRDHTRKNTYTCRSHSPSRQIYYSVFIAYSKTCTICSLRVVSSMSVISHLLYRLVML